MSEVKHPDHSEAEGDQHAGSGEPEFSIAQSNALVPLLVMAALTVLAIVVVILRSKPVIPPEGAVANKAYSPADFPKVFAEEEALLAPINGAATSAKVAFPVPAPPFTEGIYPCSTCHDNIPPNPQRRELEAMHGDIVLHHDEEHRWCLDCHDMNNRDQLRLASGALVPFTESYRLCGQCHGTQYRDWRSGIHGKRTGYWNGPKRYLLCVHCHNPHSPRFAALKPLPPPIRPQYLRAEDAQVASSAESASGKEASDAAHAE
jgi:hypothetical protein